MQSERFTWQWDDVSIELDVDWHGQGPTVLLLPALSSISTRREMRPLQARLSAKFRTVSADWPGFGDRPRRRLDWRAETYAAFLIFLINTLRPNGLHLRPAMPRLMPLHMPVHSRIPLPGLFSWHRPAVGDCRP